jgi:hypothetical protein
MTAPLPVLSLSVVVWWRHCRSSFVIPGSSFVIPGSSFVILGSLFVIPGSSFVIPGSSSVIHCPSFVGSQHLQSTPRAVAREAGGRFFGVGPSASTRDPPHEQWLVRLDVGAEH